MADGDIVHNRLRRLYHKPYKWLCEGKATSDECTRSLIKSLQQDIKKKGDIPVMLAKSMSENLIQAINNAGGIIFVDWATSRQEFNRLVEQVDAPHRLKELVLRAGRSILHDLEHGREIAFECPSEEILCRYMTEVYETGFKECIPLEADEAILERLGQIEPTILNAIHQWAKKADKDESVRKLQLRSLPKVKRAGNFEDDLLATHNHNNCKKIGELLQNTPKDLQITDQVLKQYLSALDGVSV